MKERAERWLGTVFGLMFVGLSLIVAFETALRKLFNISIQGADELGGYALAAGAAIAFSMALLGRNHIRVDVLYDKLPTRAVTALNWLSAVFMAAFAILIAWLAWYVLQDTNAYKSVAQTPWATPLIYPQAVWVAGLVVFALLALGIALHATWLLMTGRTDAANALLSPRSTRDELREELDDLKHRSGQGAGEHP